MSPDLSKLTALVADYGTFSALAEKLAESFKKVYFHNLTRTAMPVKNRDAIGQGLPGIEVVTEYKDVLPDIDLAVFPDCHDQQEQEALRQDGYRVFGMGKASEFEEDREAFRRWQLSVGLPAPKTTYIYGVSELRAYLEDHKDVWVKLVRYRGLTETFHVWNGNLAEPRLRELEHEAGSGAEELVFLIEEPIKSVCETGYDGMTCDGEYPDVGMFGFEIKDRGYAGKILPYAQLPQQIRWTNEKLKPLFKNARGMWSDELRITKDGKPHLIDPTFRFPSPPYQCELEAYKNFSEAIYQIAGGELPKLEPAGKYCALAILSSNSVDTYEERIEMPDNIRQWVKLSRHAINSEGTDIIVPQDQLHECGAVVAVEATLEAAIAKVKERAEQVHGTAVKADTDALDEAAEVVKNARRVGIQF